jgi:hypothetical protein
VTTDPFTLVLGTARGSDRVDAPLPPLLERLRQPWLAEAAASELCALISASDFLQVLPVLYTSPHSTSAASKRVERALLARLCADAEGSWRASAPSIWRFCGIVSRRAFTAKRLTAVDTIMYEATQRAALSAAIANAATSRKDDECELVSLQDLALSSYLSGVCQYMATRMCGHKLALAAVANHRRSILDSWRKQYERYEQATSPDWTRPFDEALLTLAPDKIAHALEVALNQHRRPSPNYEVDCVRERRHIYECFIMRALKNEIACRPGVWRD